MRRTGLNRPIANQVTLYIAEDLPVTDPLIVTGFITSATGSLYIVGTHLSVTHTGTLTAYTAPNPAANTLPIIQDTAVATWAPYAGKLMRLTSGVHAGQNTAFWVKKDLTGHNGQVTMPMFRDPLPVGGASFAPAGNETYEIVTPRLLGGGLVINIQPLYSTLLYAGSASTCMVDYCAVPAYITPNVIDGSSTYTFYYACQMGTVSGSGNSNTFINCQFNNLAAFQGTANQIMGGWFNACILSIEGHSLLFELDYNNVECPVAITGGSFVTVNAGWAAGGTLQVAGGIQVDGVTNYFNLAGGFVLYVASNIYGTAATGTMYKVGSGCKIITTAVANLRIGGATNDITVAGKTQVYPQAATGQPAAAVQTCSLANLANAAVFNGNIFDPFTGTAVLTAA